MGQWQVLPWALLGMGHGVWGMGEFLLRTLLGPLCLSHHPHRSAPRSAVRTHLSTPITHTHTTHAP